MIGGQPGRDSVDVDRDSSNSDYDNDASDLFNGLSSFISSLLVHHPIINGMASSNHHWVGHNLEGDCCIFSQLKQDLAFEPFCVIESFEVLWKSKEDEEGERDYLLKPIPKFREYYKALGYCYYRGASSQPDMNEEPWSQLRAVHISLLEELPYKAELKWLDTSDCKNPCSIWTIVPSKKVLPNNLFLVTTDEELPQRVSLIKEEFLQFPSWLSPAEYERNLETYGSSSVRDQFRIDSAKDDDRSLPTYLGKLLMNGNAETKLFAIESITEIAKYPNLRDGIRSSIPQLKVLCGFEDQIVADSAEMALFKLAEYREFTEELTQAKQPSLISTSKKIERSEGG
ncbi:hypothetical protein CPB86DRAFT_789077 [Serendipita vermifera]|nr:hypothetical protein CPB86DRAFT_789077 [Serendipita vermifera]